MLSLFSGIVMFCCAETDNQNIRTGRAWVGGEARQEINIHCQYFLHIFLSLSILFHTTPRIGLSVDPLVVGSLIHWSVTKRQRIIDICITIKGQGSRIIIICHVVSLSDCCICVFSLLCLFVCHIVLLFVALIVNTKVAIHKGCCESVALSWVKKK